MWTFGGQQLQADNSRTPSSVWTPVLFPQDVSTCIFRCRGGSCQTARRANVVQLVVPEIGHARHEKAAGLVLQHK